jgi:hypothetical protein
MKIIKNHPVSSFFLLPYYGQLVGGLLEKILNMQFILD